MIEKKYSIQLEDERQRCFNAELTLSHSAKMRKVNAVEVMSPAQWNDFHKDEHCVIVWRFAFPKYLT